MHKRQSDHLATANPGARWLLGGDDKSIMRLAAESAALIWLPRTSKCARIALERKRAVSEAGKTSVVPLEPL